jgi:hypothetical protein
MAKKSMLARALGLGNRIEEEAPLEPTPEIEEIFQAIRSGDVPWSIDELPSDARRATKLLFELDRAWLRPSG